MKIEAIPRDEQELWVTCSEQVDGGASRVRGWHNTKECGNKATWLVDGKRYCTMHKNKLFRAGQ